MTASGQSGTTTIQGMEVSWESVRSLFSLDPTVSHLNHGSFGAVPVPVQRSEHRFLDEMDANPMAFFTRGLIERIGHTRRHVAMFVGADPEGTALIPNATTGAQLALTALRPGPGDEILMTDHGYGAVRFAVDRACARTGATVSVAEVPLGAGDDEIVDILIGSVRPGRTRFAIVDHIASSTAKLFPIARIVAALRQLDVAVVVDGAHAPGMLPLDVTAIGADVWFGNLYKWAFAPRQAAVLVVAPEYRDKIEPLTLSWEREAGFPVAVEYAGTMNYTPWLAAPTALHLLRTLGTARVQRHNADLAAYGQRTLATALGVDHADLVGSDQVSMRVVPLPPGLVGSRDDATDIMGEVAADLGCEIAVFHWGGRGYLRLSAQVYNRVEEYDRLAEGLPALLRNGSAAGWRPAA